MFLSQESDPISIAKKEKNTILNMPIRGIDGVKSAFIHEMNKYHE
jgi:hypothetical protein